MSTIHADMLVLQAAYPWQMPEFVAAEDADILAFHDEAREAWLDDWLADLEEPEVDELIVEYMAPPPQPQWLMTSWLMWRSPLPRSPVPTTSRFSRSTTTVH